MLLRLNCRDGAQFPGEKDIVFVLFLVVKRHAAIAVVVDVVANAAANVEVFEDLGDHIDGRPGVPGLGFRRNVNIDRKRRPMIQFARYRQVLAQRILLPLSQRRGSSSGRRRRGRSLKRVAQHDGTIESLLALVALRTLLALSLPMHVHRQLGLVIEGRDFLPLLHLGLRLR